MLNIRRFLKSEYEVHYATALIIHKEDVYLLISAVAMTMLRG